MCRKLTALLICVIMLLSSFALAYSPNDYSKEQPEVLYGDMLYAKSAILIDADTGSVLFGKNENELMSPASTTKIMTLLLALESGIPLDQEIAIPQAAGDAPSGSSLIPVYPGETMTFGDLLTGFQVHSGNDGALAIAVLVSGTVDNFVSLMNQRAQELGLTNTHYANPHGYTQEGHYTTAYDLAVLTSYAMQNETFRKIVSTVSGSIYVKERGEIRLYSKTYIMKPDSQYYYAECIGVKTGTTNAAGECFVGAAERDGATIISVVLKEETDDQRWIDTIHLFDFGWTQYEQYTLDKMYNAASSRIANCVVSNAVEDDPYGGRLDLDIAQISDDSYLRMILADNTGAIDSAVSDFVQNSRVVITHDLTAPISVGEIIGDFSYTDPSTGKAITAKLVASRDVEERTVVAKLTDVFPSLKIFENKIFLLLLVVIFLLLILIIALAASRRAAKQRRRRRIYEQRRAEYMRRQRQQPQRRPQQRSNPSNHRPSAQRPQNNRRSR